MNGASKVRGWGGDKGGRGDALIIGAGRRDSAVFYLEWMQMYVSKTDQLARFSTNDATMSGDFWDITKDTTIYLLCDVDESDLSR